MFRSVYVHSVFLIIQFLIRQTIINFNLKFKRAILFHPVIVFLLLAHARILKKIVLIESFDNTEIPKTTCINQVRLISQAQFK